MDRYRTRRRRRGEAREEPAELGREGDVVDARGGREGEDVFARMGDAVKARGFSVGDGGEVDVEEVFGETSDELDELVGVDLAGVVADDLQLAEREGVLHGERREKVMIGVVESDDVDVAA